MNEQPARRELPTPPETERRGGGAGGGASLPLDQWLARIQWEGPDIAGAAVAAGTQVCVLLISGSILSPADWRLLVLATIVPTVVLLVGLAARPTYRRLRLPIICVLRFIICVIINAQVCVMAHGAAGRASCCHTALAARG